MIVIQAYILHHLQFIVACESVLDFISRKFFGLDFTS